MAADVSFGRATIFSVVVFVPCFVGTVEEARRGLPTRPILLRTEENIRGHRIGSIVSAM